MSVELIPRPHSIHRRLPQAPLVEYYYDTHPRESTLRAFDVLAPPDD